MNMPSKFVESIRNIADFPNDEECIRLSGNDLASHLGNTAERYHDPLYTDRKPPAKHTYKTRRRQASELGNNCVRIAINEILYVLERRVVNQGQLPSIAAEVFPALLEYPPAELSLSEQEALRTPIHLRYEKTIYEGCRKLFLALEVEDHKHTQRKRKPRSSCPACFSYNEGYLGEVEFSKLVEKQIKWDAQLIELLETHANELPSPETTRALSEALKVYLSALTQWLDIKVPPERQWRKTHEHIPDKSDDTKFMSVLSVHQVRRIQFTKDCQRSFERLTGNAADYDAGRTVFNQFCAKFAQHLGDTTFTEATANRLLRDNPYRPWINDLIYDAIQGCSDDPESQLHAAVQVLRAEKFPVPKDDELQRQIAAVVRGAEQAENIGLRLLKKNPKARRLALIAAYFEPLIDDMISKLGIKTNGVQ